MLKAVTYILENNPSVQQAVGAKSHEDNHKVYPVVVPQTEKAPYIVVRIAGKIPLGKNCNNIYTIEVLCYHSSYDDVSELSEAVVSALTTQAHGMINGFQFSFLNFSNESDSFDKDHDLFAKVLTFEGT